MTGTDRRTDLAAITGREVLDLARQVCTTPQLDALILIAAGHSERQAADALHISRSALRDRIRTATRRILDHMEPAK